VHEAELKLSPTEDDPRHTIGRVAIYRDLVRLAPHKALPDLYHHNQKTLLPLFRSG